MFHPPVELHAAIEQEERCLAPMQVVDLLLEQMVPPNYFYAKKNLRGLLNGYSDSDLVLILQDLNTLLQTTFDGVTKERDYLVTAGGPASGKSTLLESLLNGGECPGHLNLGCRRAYIDPDRSCMQKMEKTHLADLAGGCSYETSYTKWRNASNFISNLLLAYACKHGYAIAHGSTMATPYAAHALEGIKQMGYTVTLLHLTCPEEIRKQSETLRRAQGIVQCTDEDFINKQELFLTLLPTYLNYHVIFAYREAIDAINWVGESFPQEGMTLFHEKGWEEVMALHQSTGS